MRKKIFALLGVAAFAVPAFAVDLASNNGQAASPAVAAMPDAAAASPAMNALSSDARDSIKPEGNQPSAKSMRNRPAAGIIVGPKTLAPAPASPSSAAR